MSFLAAVIAASGSFVIAQQKSTFSQLQEKAKKASDENRLNDAARLYARALALKPAWADGWWALGTLEYDRDRYAKAAQAFEKLIALQPSNGTAHAMLGLCQFELGKDDLALKNLLAAENLGIVKDAQLRKVALYHLGVLDLRTRKFSKAKEVFAILASEGVNSDELTNGLGLAALMVRPQDAPREGTAEVHVVQRVGLAEMMLARKNFDGAKQAYAPLASEHPDFPNLTLAYGRCLLDTHDVEEAVREFRRVLERDPKDVNALLEIAAVRYQENSQEGLKYAEEAVKVAPALPFAHYLVGLLRLDTGDAAGAIPELEIAKKAFPSEPTVFFSLGKAYARVGRKEEAVKARAEFIRLNARAEKQQGPTTYGERPSGFAGGIPQNDETERPRP